MKKRGRRPSTAWVSLILSFMAGVWLLAVGSTVMTRTLPFILIEEWLKNWLLICGIMISICGILAISSFILILFEFYPLGGILMFISGFITTVLSITNLVGALPGAFEGIVCGIMLLISSRFSFASALQAAYI